MDEQGALQSQRRIANTWRRLHWTWYSYFYLFSLLAILLSTLIASKPGLLRWTEDVYQFLAWLLAVITAGLTLFKPNERATRYRQAWMGLSIAIDRYSAVRNTSLETVLAAREAGEKQIHQVSG